MVRKPYLMRVSSMLAQIFQVKPYFSLIFANFCCCYFIIVLKNSFPVFDTLIKTLAMLRKHLRSCKPLRFASWFAYSLNIARVWIRVLNTEKTGFYCLNIYLTLQFFVRFSTSLRFGRIYFKVHLHPDVKFWYRILISRSH